MPDRKPDSVPAVTAYIGMGSNLDDPVRQICGAIAAMSELPQCRVTGSSSLYRSRALGSQDQPDYINAVAALRTYLSAIELLRDLQALETAHGRRRGKVRWEARPLDLDILLFGDQHIETQKLTVPHTELHRREFVLFPLLEIAPTDLQVPGKGSLVELVRGCPPKGLRRLRKGCRS